MIFIGIAGPSGAGKTTLANFLKANFQNEFEHIRLDDYLRHPDSFPMKGRYKNWEHPQNYRFDLLLDHLQQLKGGRKVLGRSFSPNRSIESHEYYLEPKPFVLVDGSLVLTNEDVAVMFDKKIFLDIPAELMIQRRKERPNHFGIDTEEYDRLVTIPEFEKYGLVQKTQADYIVDGTQDKASVAKQIQDIVMEQS